VLSAESKAPWQIRKGLIDRGRVVDDGAEMNAPVGHVRLGAPRTAAAMPIFDPATAVFAPFGESGTFARTVYQNLAIALR